MYSRPHRFAGEKNIALLMRRGRQFSAGEISIKVGHRPSGTTWRFAVTVGTKVSKRAVVRNQLRRRIREILRQSIPSLIGAGDIMVMTRPGAEKLEFDQIKLKMLRLFNQAGIIKAN